MKHRARNALIRVAAAASVRAQPGKRALAFHEVPDPGAFAEFLDRALERYEILPIDRWLADPVGDRTQLTLTFDDGYASWHEAVAPILEERQLPAAFFVASGLVGLEGEPARRFIRERMRRTQELRPITHRQLADLSESPLFEIGGHTEHHSDLGSIEDPELIRAELIENRNHLGDWLGTQPRWFAYPFGTPANTSPLARALVAQCGYSAAFTLVPGWRDPAGGNDLMIGRDGVDPAHPFSLWSAWLAGGYDRIYALKPSSLRARSGRRPGSREGG